MIITTYYTTVVCIIIIIIMNYYSSVLLLTNKLSLSDASSPYSPARSSYRYVSFQGESHAFKLVHVQTIHNMSFSLKIKKCKIYTCGKLTFSKTNGVHFRVTKHLSKAVFRIWESDKFDSAFTYR